MNKFTHSYDPLRHQRFSINLDLDMNVRETVQFQKGIDLCMITSVLNINFDDSILFQN
jgi:hypothetical protein